MKVERRIRPTRRIWAGTGLLFFVALAGCSDNGDVTQPRMGGPVLLGPNQYDIVVTGDIEHTTRGAAIHGTIPWPETGKFLHRIHFEPIADTPFESISFMRLSEAPNVVGAGELPVKQVRLGEWDPTNPALFEGGWIMQAVVRQPGALSGPVLSRGGIFSIDAEADQGLSGKLIVFLEGMVSPADGGPDEVMNLTMEGSFHAVPGDIQLPDS